MQGHGTGRRIVSSSRGLFHKNSFLAAIPLNIISIANFLQNVKAVLSLLTENGEKNTVLNCKLFVNGENACPLRSNSPSERRKSEKTLDKKGKI